MKNDTNAPTNHQDDVKKVGTLIKGIQMAMLTTLDPDGNLHSRPMATQEAEFDGTIWFFTGKSTGKIHAIENDSHVNLSYANPDGNTYVSIAGLATLVDDKAKAKELWTPAMKAWFPEGVEDPNLILLKVEAQSAQYWDSPSSTVVKIIGFTKAILTGQPYRGGENKKVDLRQ